MDVKSVSFGEVVTPSGGVEKTPPCKRMKECVFYTRTLTPSVLYSWKEEVAARNGKLWDLVLEKREVDVVEEYELKEGKPRSGVSSDATVRVVSLLQPAECKAIIDVSERIGYLDPAEQNHPDIYALRPGNKSGLLYLESQEFANSLWSRISHLITAPLNLQCSAFLGPENAFICACAPGPSRPFGIHPRMKLLRYTHEQLFKPHTDSVIRVTSIGPHRGSFRNAFTIAIYLNSSSVEYEGGKLRFLSPPRIEVGGGTAITRYDELPTPVCMTPTAGHAAIFSPQHWHTAEPVISGTKYMIQADIMYAR